VWNHLGSPPFYYISYYSGQNPRFGKIAETPVFTGAGDKTRTYDLMITNRSE